MGHCIVWGTGWGGLGEEDGEEVPEGVFVLHQRYVPHDWLFPQCAAVIHHGGAGVVPPALLFIMRQYTQLLQPVMRISLCASSSL